MRNIADIIEDDRKGKQLSQTERQIAVAYYQGKYDAVRELKIGDNSNAMEVLDKIIAEIEEVSTYDGIYIDRSYVLEIIDKYKYKAESEVEG